jgi:hypothetical protein
MTPMQWLRVCPSQGRERVRALLEEIAWIPFLPPPPVADGRQPMAPPTWSRHAAAWVPPRALPPPGVQSLRDHASAYLRLRGLG